MFNSLLFMNLARMFENLRLPMNSVLYMNDGEGEWGNEACGGSANITLESFVVVCSCNLFQRKESEKRTLNNAKIKVFCLSHGPVS